MIKAKINIYKCIQDSQDYGSDDEHMVSRIFFNLEIDDKKYDNLYVDVKQAVGSDFETGPIEIGNPFGYKGPFNYKEFREKIENYYRSLVGSKGRGIHIQGGRNIRMRNNIFMISSIFEFEVDDTVSSW